ncbi:hypothetical protein TU73_27355 [Pseudomonas libanensis]|uniref:Uncharacterized protein n=1 Tax=Pseudomonas libanensis TaxID=75588 RepID=A0A0R2XYW7_9PSED|nr:hypothetical protein TU73_27355 [Pseudomonas libanensis]
MVGVSAEIVRLSLVRFAPKLSFSVPKFPLNSQFSAAIAIVEHVIIIVVINTSSASCSLNGFMNRAALAGKRDTLNSPGTTTHQANLKTHRLSTIYQAT